MDAIVKDCLATAGQKFRAIVRRQTELVGDPLTHSIGIESFPRLLRGEALMRLSVRFSAAKVR